MLKIAGVVILYNPKKEYIDNILSYISQVERVYVVDNSENDNPIIKDLELYNNIQKINNEGNIGMAAALNLAATKAIDEGFDLLLTMDQDSSISSNYINDMLGEFEKDDNIGLLSPFILHTENPKEPIISDIINITIAITSGSIIKLTAHKKIGGFLNKLFIDYVDHEYCLRMKSFGFKILRLNSVCIYHTLGNAKARKFFFTKVFPTNHSALRWYYRTRNRFYVCKVYKEGFPEYVKTDRLEMVKEFLKIVLYEKNKLEKFTMIFRGYIDFKKNKFGKLITR